MTHAVSKPVADFGDNVADAIFDLIDAEPEDIATALLQRAYRQDWDLERVPPATSNPMDGGHMVCRFGEVREYVIPLLRVPAAG